MNTSSVARSEQKTLSLTRILLLCGAIAGPLFLLTLLIQDSTRPGFDPRLDPLSLLSLGDCGFRSGTLCWPECSISSMLLASGENYTPDGPEHGDRS
jgi:hypothetical protein